MGELSPSSGLGPLTFERLATEMTAKIPMARRQVARRLNSLQQGGLPVDVAFFDYAIAPGNPLAAAARETSVLTVPQVEAHLLAGPRPIAPAGLSSSVSSGAAALLALQGGTIEARARAQIL